MSEEKQITGIPEKEFCDICDKMFDILINEKLSHYQAKLILDRVNRYLDFDQVTDHKISGYRNDD